MRRGSGIMRFIKVLVVLVAVITLASCGQRSKFQTYDGPVVTLIQINKTERRMHLIHNDTVLRSYDIALGFAPFGHKQFEGDGRTPEGLYRINRRNPNSEYHLSLGISYPNAQDVAFAEAAGLEPGGDIFIHGWSEALARRPDWTAGCIAVSDREIEEIYAMVRDGTVINILP
jgi:murein L,D-transpeptidase YafK